MPKRMARPILSDAGGSQRTLNRSLYVLHVDVMPPHFAGTRIDRELVGGKKGIATLAPVRRWVFPIQRVRQINFAETSLEIADMQLTDEFNLLLQWRLQ